MCGCKLFLIGFLEELCAGIVFFSKVCHVLVGFKNSGFCNYFELWFSEFHLGLGEDWM